MMSHVTTTTVQTRDNNSLKKASLQIVRIIFVSVMASLIMSDLYVALQNGDLRVVVSTLFIPPFMYHRSIFAIMCLLLCKI